MIGIGVTTDTNPNDKPGGGLPSVKLIYVATRKDPAAVALGRKGGKARKKKLSPEQRSEIARKGGLAGGRGRGKK